LFGVEEISDERNEKKDGNNRNGWLVTNMNNEVLKLSNI
jgi:hypothetical protein